ncbi:TonB-dependent receptor [Chitinophaga barathri]|nr:TonB-dependent receptor [Chitinophaga barathri]
MTKHLFFLVYLLGALSIAAYAEDGAGNTGNISGKITTSDGQPAASVAVEVEGLRKNAISNDKGNFLIKNVPSGVRRIRISLLGYETVIREVTVENDMTVNVSIQLEVSQTQLKEVTVTDQRNRIADKHSAYVSRMDLKNLENPQSYSVATKELLLEKNVQDYQTAVRSIPGIALSTESYQGISEVLMRGFTATPYIRNGIYFMNLIATDVQNIERLEAIKGPSGTLYGSQGISYGGLINKVTKKPLKRHMGEAGLSIGSFGLSRLTADFNTPLNEDQTALLRVNAGASRQGSFQDNGYNRSLMLAPSLSYQVNDRFEILVDVELSSVNRPALTSYPVYSAFAAGFDRYDKVPLDYFKTYGTNRADYPPSTTYNIFGQLNYKLGRNWTLSTNIAYADFNFNSGTIGLTLGAPDTLVRDLYDFYWEYNSIDIQPNLTGEFMIGSVKNKVLAGLDYQHIKTVATGYFLGPLDKFNYKDSYPLFPVKAIRASQAYSDTYYEADFKQDAYAAYISDVISFNDRLNILLSLRYDHYKDGGYQYRGAPAGSPGPDEGAFAPKVGITYQVLKDKMTVFANYMQGIKYVAPDITGNVFKPERANQMEGGVKIDLVNGKLSSTISYYDIQVKDKVRPSPANPNISVQDGTQESKGVDVDIIASPAAGLNIVAGYGYNSSKFKKDAAGKEGKRPFGTPLNSGNIWVSYTLQQSAARGLGIGAGAVYSDEYFATDDNNLVIPGFTVFNANLFYNQPRYRLALSMDNITDKRYWNIYGTPQMPRRVTGTVTFRF